MLLMSKSREQFLLLDLLPIGAREHAGWHSYRIEVGLIDGSASAVLAPTVDHPLFLDERVEPEVPLLCAGVERVLREGGTYTFEPIDERDFVLAVNVERDRVWLRLDATDRPFPAATGWPVGLEVDADALRRFAGGLVLEFEQVRTPSR